MPKSRPPYPSEQEPFWLLRCLAYLPGGAWARAAVVGGAVVAAHLAMLGLGSGTGESWRAYDLNLGLLLAVQGAYAAAALPRILSVMRREAEALTPLLQGGARDAERHLRRVLRPPASGVWATSVLGIVIGGFLTFTVAISRQEVAADGIRVGATIPQFAALDENGELFDSSSLDGKPILMKFFRGHW